MTTNTQNLNHPHIHIDNHQAGTPARLYWPADSDPSLIVSQFPPGFFTWNEAAGCATFDAHRSTDVLNGAHQDFPEVGISYGPSVYERESSTGIKRSPSARPKNWRAMGPRVPMAA
ncbi:hypothetical protein [Streptomyces sp. NPDC096033]|uniref:hypothetical protein n=1 Tax=Streptomyces sp. NPDC096033 TaxID=3366071 RepID=UPI0037F580AC